MNITSEALTESKLIRETYISRIDVLERVKKLDLLPDGINITIEMAANYYVVGRDAIEKVIRENRAELQSDGLKVLEGQSLSAYKAETGFTIRAGKLTIFPRRALLRMGMLLRDSEVAVEVRSMLLDKEQESKPSNVVQIPTELNMIGNLLEVSNQSFKAMIQMQAQINEVAKSAEDARSKALQSEEKSNALEKELNDVKNGLVDVNLPLRTQFNDAVKVYRGKQQLDWDKAYNNIYSILGKQHNVNIKLRAENRKVKPIDIIEELNLLVPAIRLAKTLAGVA